jgi:hypothetical protein
MSVRSTPAPMPNRKRPSSRLSTSAAWVAVEQRMAERQVRYRGAELDVFGKAGERCAEHQARRNILGEIGQVLAAITFAVAELVGEDESIAVFAQRLGIIPLRADGPA